MPIITAAIASATATDTKEVIKKASHSDLFFTVTPDMPS
jgi:hypothetical protein